MVDTSDKTEQFDLINQFVTEFSGLIRDIIELSTTFPTRMPLNNFKKLNKAKDESKKSIHEKISGTNTQKIKSGLSDNKFKIT